MRGNVYCAVRYVVYILKSRYLARAVLIPFTFDPPPIVPDFLGTLLHEAPAALPQVLQIGRALVNMDSDIIQSMCDTISTLISGLDGRLLMQYTLLILFTQMVIVIRSILFFTK